MTANGDINVAKCHCAYSAKAKTDPMKRAYGSHGP